MGTPADVRRRSRRACGKDYFATTTANVISTAGDATLTVADPSATATGQLVNGAFSLPEPLQANAGSAPPRHLRAGRRLVRADHAEDLGGPVSNDAVDDRLQAADQGQRRAAHRHVRQDADLHAVDDDP